MPDSRDLYIFYSQYSRRSQGVGVARLAWADRDNPVGKAMVFASGVWLPARAFTFPSGMVRWIYPSAIPIFPAKEPWNDDDTEVDAFWGPAVHWNVYLEQYVMLLNHAQGHELEAGRHLRLVQPSSGRPRGLVAAGEDPERRAVVSAGDGHRGGCGHRQGRGPMGALLHGRHLRAPDSIHQVGGLGIFVIS